MVVCVGRVRSATVTLQTEVIGERCAVCGRETREARPVGETESAVRRTARAPIERSLSLLYYY